MQDQQKLSFQLVRISYSSFVVVVVHLLEEAKFDFVREAKGFQVDFLVGVVDKKSRSLFNVWQAYLCTF